MDILLLRHALIKRQPTDEPKKENFTDSVSFFAKYGLLGIFGLIVLYIFFQVLILVISLDCTQNTKDLWWRAFYICIRQILGVFYLIFHLIVTRLFGITKCGKKDIPKKVN